MEELAKMMPRAYVTPRNETDANNNQSKGKIASTISDSSAMVTNQQEEMEEDLLDYEPEKDVDLTRKVSKEVREPEGKKKRVNRGKKKKEKKHPEVEEEEEEETVTILRSEYLELTQMKTLMRVVVQRLAIVERPQKRASTSNKGGVPAKAKKLTPPSVRDKLFARPVPNCRLPTIGSAHGSVASSLTNWVCVKPAVILMNSLLL